MEYSENLIKRIQKYWRNRFNEELSAETADLYLDSLGGIYLLFYEEANPR